MTEGKFRLWAIYDALFGTDIRHGGYTCQSRSYSLKKEETMGGPPFDSDICLNLGDFTGS